MRIHSVRLKNFKRFTDLEIKNIPSSAKLVVVVGPNGCGKSSLFDAFNHWHRQQTGIGFDSDELYFRKDSAAPFDWGPNFVDVTLHGGATVRKGCIYLRTAFRNDPDFSVSTIERPGVPTEFCSSGKDQRE